MKEEVQVVKDDDNIENIEGEEILNNKQKETAGVAEEFIDLNELQPQTQQREEPKQAPVTISQIMQQISKATDKIDKIQPRNKVDANQQDEEAEFNFGEEPKKEEKEGS